MRAWSDARIAEVAAERWKYESAAEDGAVGAAPIHCSPPHPIRGRAAGELRRIRRFVRVVAEEAAMGGGSTIGGCIMASDSSDGPPPLDEAVVVDAAAAALTASGALPC